MSDLDTNSIKSYRDLRVWQAGVDLTQCCYELTRTFPRDETFGLTSQIRRAATSIPANIAEGYGRDSRGDYVHFLRIAQGSLKELETHLIISERVGLVSMQEVGPLLDRSDEIGRMLRTLYRRLQSS